MRASLNLRTCIYNLFDLLPLAQIGLQNADLFPITTSVILACVRYSLAVVYLLE